MAVCALHNHLRNDPSLEDFMTENYDASWHVPYVTTYSRLWGHESADAMHVRQPYLSNNENAGSSHSQLQ
jgi:hypothetical protein